MHQRIDRRISGKWCGVSSGALRNLSSRIRSQCQFLLWQPMRSVGSSEYRKCLWRGRRSRSSLFSSHFMLFLALTSC
eukprot:g27561.t1